MTEIDVASTLQARRGTHGDWSRQATLAQAIKNAMRQFSEWDELPATVRESLEMIAHKMSRAVIGDPQFHDHWHDIQGYARLIADHIRERQLSTEREGVK
ncbi:MAG: hypothetical protein IT562_10750 [Alphaproteobacteria bacterium]|nr:hypothetical protein [Alphaproteobacteria bacterium]